MLSYETSPWLLFAVVRSGRSVGVGPGFRTGSGPIAFGVTAIELTVIGWGYRGRRGTLFNLFKIAAGSSS